MTHCVQYYAIQYAVLRSGYKISGYFRMAETIGMGWQLAVADGCGW